MWALTHQSTRRPRPARPPRAPAGIWTRCTGSGGSQCPDSALGSAPPPRPHAWVPAHHRLAGPFRIPVAGTRRLRRVGSTSRPEHGPTRRPGTPQRGHHSGSVRPSAAGCGRDLGRETGDMGGAGKCQGEGPSACKGESTTNSPRAPSTLSPLCPVLLLTHLSRPRWPRFPGHRRGPPGCSLGNSTNRALSPHSETRRTR